MGMGQSRYRQTADYCEQTSESWYTRLLYTRNHRYKNRYKQAAIKAYDHNRSVDCLSPLPCLELYGVLDKTLIVTHRQCKARPAVTFPAAESKVWLLTGTELWRSVTGTVKANFHRTRFPVTSLWQMLRGNREHVNSCLVSDLSYVPL